MKAFIKSPDNYVQECWTDCVQLADIESAQFVYEDYDVQDFEARDPSKLYYSYVYRKGLIRKNYLANRIAYYVAKSPKSILATSFPESFNLELDFAEFLDDSLDESYELRQAIDEGNKTWIIKPAMADRAQGIHIFKTVDALQAIVDEMGDEEDGELPFRHFVVQEYLSNPLLVEGTKFHIRTYIVCCGALKVWVYNDMLALFSGSPFMPVLDERVMDMAPHLTNTCAQDKRTFDPNVVKLLSSLDIDPSIKTKVIHRIHDIVHDLFDAQVGDPINFQPLPNALEFYGLDFLVSDAGEPTLLEANAYPDFGQTGDLKQLVKGFFQATTDTVIGGYFGDSIENHKLALVYEKAL